MSSTLPRWAAGLCLVLVLLGYAWPRLGWTAAAPTSDLVLDPPAITFSPERETLDATLRIHNPGPSPLSIDRIVVRGGDWGGFAITDETTPHSVPPQGSVDLHLRADPLAFETGKGEYGEASYRQGRAKLVIHAQESRELPLDFTPRTRVHPAPRAGLLLIWALVLFGATRGGGELPTQTSARVLVFAATLATLAALPLAGGWCSGDASLAWGPLSRARCRCDLGGTALSVAPPRYGAWWLLGGGATYLALSLRREGRRSRIEFFALLGCSLFALSFRAQAWDVAAWNYESFSPHPGLFLAALLAYARVQAQAPSRLDNLVWCAVFTSVFLAGPSLGPLQPLVESSSAHLGLGLGVFALKLGLVQQLARWLTDLWPDERVARLRPFALAAALADLAWTLFGA